MSNNPVEDCGVVPYTTEKPWKQYKTFCSKIVLFHDFLRGYLESSMEL